MKNIALLIFVAVIMVGCSTSGQADLTDFNSKFKESIPVNPRYKIETAGPRYLIVVYQGSSLISERTTRAAFLTRAAMIAMSAHCSERSSALGEHSFEDRVDSMGYVNVLGFFSCKPVK